MRLHQPLPTAGGTLIEDSLPDVASRPVRRSFLEPKRQGEVGSFRRRGEVGRTTTSTTKIHFSPLTIHFLRLTLISLLAQIG
jgi:hypothetical protein